MVCRGTARPCLTRRLPRPRFYPAGRYTVRRGRGPSRGRDNVGAQPFDNLRFSSDLLKRPPVRAFDVVTKLGHFALVTYAVEPWRVRPHVHPRFDLDRFRAADGAERVWVSMVPFEDQDFHFGFAPWATFC